SILPAYYQIVPASFVPIRDSSYSPVIMFSLFCIAMTRDSSAANDLLKSAITLLLSIIPSAHALIIKHAAIGCPWCPVYKLSFQLMHMPHLVFDCNDKAFRHYSIAVDVRFA